MANKHLKLEPHNITDDCWWYECGAGIAVIVRGAAPNGEAAEYRISWRALRMALERKDRKDVTGSQSHLRGHRGNKC